MNNETVLGSLDPELLETVATRRDAIRGAGNWGLGLALASLPLALAAMAKDAFAQGVPADIASVLNFALVLEELEAEFYVRGTAAASLIPAADRQIFTTIRDHEVEHVRFLRAALGSQAVAKPTFDFTAGGAFADVFTNYATFRAVAQAFEDTGVRAYKGQAPLLLASRPILRAALTIHSVEARHASEVRRLNGNFTEQAPQKGWITLNQRGVVPAAAAAVYAGEENTTHAGLNVTTFPGVGGNLSAEAASEAFDEPLTRAQVIAIVDPFIVEPIS